MSTKLCFKCSKVKCLSEFYAHKQMKDGHVNKCKQCNKVDVTKNRSSNIDHYREYDRNRGNRQSSEYRADYKAKYPIKFKAHNIVNNSIRDGKLFKQPCEVCLSDELVHAHHDDYSKPLNVRWLCPVHHSKWHYENGEGLNAI